MKVFSIVLLFLFLTSCGSNVTTDSNSAVQKTQEDVYIATASLPETVEQVPVEEEVESHEDTQEIEIVEVDVPDVQEATIPKVIELSTTYNNPKIEVVMDIDIELDANDRIAAISVTSPNYGGMPKFDDKVQGTIGMTLEEASDFHASGSSLGTAAFQKVLKNL